MSTHWVSGQELCTIAQKSPKKYVDGDRTLNYGWQAFGKLVIHTDGCGIPPLQKLVPATCVGLSRKLDVALAQWDYTGFGNFK